MSLNWEEDIFYWASVKKENLKMEELGIR
jgi:hypothetical protein